MRSGYRSSSSSSFYAALVALLLASVVGCNTAPKSEEKKDALVDQAQATLKEMQAQDSSLQGFIDRGYGHVVFPTVGKGGLGVGGAYGRGVVYRGNEMSGYADLTQASIGLQAGGQSFGELIVFENQETYNKFTASQLQFGANASAIALKTGAGSAATFQNGLAVFVMPKGGLMAELSLSGQQFKYQPK
jgi:lipid-binding SYLF domain-containing protein